MLKLNREEMRSFGYRVIDLLVDHFETIGSRRSTNRLSRAELDARLMESVPEKSSTPESVLNEFETKISDAIMHGDHPRFFAFIPSPSNFVSVMADALASGFTVFAGTWFEASGPAEVELVTIDWLRSFCGLPPEAGGLFVSGASVANLTALATARHIQLADEMDRAVVYYSDQTHSSVDRALRILGFRTEQIRKLKCDDHFRLDLQTLTSAVEKDRKMGMRPFCVVANAGTTNTGDIDPLPELAQFCKEQNLWLHIDGAYGVAAALTERGKKLLKGIELAHSLTLDPHKWLFQPFEIGCLLVRDRRWLRQTFHIMPEYLKDSATVEQEVNFCEYGIQLTRSFRALKLWMSLKVFGREAFVAAIERGFIISEFAASLISEMKDWELLTGPNLGILNFRYAPAGVSLQIANQLNQKISQEMIRDGFALIVTTTLRNMNVLRICPINPRTTEEDIRETFSRLDRIAKSLY